MYILGINYKKISGVRICETLLPFTFLLYTVRFVVMHGYYGLFLA